MKRKHGRQDWPLALSAILSIGVAVAIFCFSAQTSEISDGMSSELAMRLLRWLGADAGEESVALCDVILRKTAHFMLYALFGFGLCGVFRRQRRIPAVLAATALCALYACSDEVHQLFIDGRTARLLDVAIDACGALTGATLSCVFSGWRRKREEGA